MNYPVVTTNFISSQTESACRPDSVFAQSREALQNTQSATSPVERHSMFKSLALAMVLALSSLAVLAQHPSPIVVLVKVFPSPGRENELQALYLKRLDYLRKAEPEVNFKLHRGIKEPTVFLWYEVYPSQAAYDNHVKVVMANFRKDFGPTPEGILTKPSESETFSALEP